MIQQYFKSEHDEYLHAFLIPAIFHGKQQPFDQVSKKISTVECQNQGIQNPENAKIWMQLPPVFKQHSCNLPTSQNHLQHRNKLFIIQMTQLFGIQVLVRCAMYSLETGYKSTAQNPNQFGFWTFTVLDTRFAILRFESFLQPEN